MDQIDQDQVPQSNFKTISSGDDTNPHTTFKKHINDTPIQQGRTNPHHEREIIRQEPARRKLRYYSLQQSMQELVLCSEDMKERKQYFLKTKKYKAADHVENKIRRATSALAHSQLIRIKKSQSKQKRDISKAHQYEMKHFNRVWNEYFERLKYVQNQALIKFKQQQKKDIQIARFKLMYKCKSLRSKNGEIISLEKKEQMLIRQGRLNDLTYIQHQKRRISTKVEKQRESTVAKWTKIEEDFLTNKHTKKYTTLITKLEENRSDKEKAFLREQKRLKQKYKNVLRQLQHEQKMEMNAFAQRFEV